MRFRSGFIALALVASFGVLLIGGCTTTTSPSGPAPAPSGTTTVEVGSGGSASLTVGSGSGQASIVVIAQSLTDPTGSPVNSTNNLNISNIDIKIWSTTTTTQSVTVNSVTYQGGSAGSPISYAMTMDRSGSMYYADIASMEAAVVSFIQNSGASDQGAIINFGSTVAVDQVLTTDKTLLTLAATQPSSVGSMTALYDSIGTAVTTAAAGSNTRKAAIAFTDGGENSSLTYTTTTAVISHAVTNGVPVYCVGLGTSPGSAAELSMKAIASGTGGFYYYAPTATEVADLYNRISTALSSSWTVDFTSSTTFVTGTTYYVLITVTYEGGITGSILFTITL